MVNFNLNKISHFTVKFDDKCECILIFFNSLAPGRSEYNSEYVIFNLVLLISIFRYSHDNALRWMTQYLTDDKSTLVQVMACCRQATSHYLSLCWPRSLSPHGVTRPQWVKITGHARLDLYFCTYMHIDGSIQDCSISIANALEILQSCSKPSIYFMIFYPGGCWWQWREDDLLLMLCIWTNSGPVLAAEVWICTWGVDLH